MTADHIEDVRGMVPVYQIRPDCENWIDCTEKYYAEWKGDKRTLYNHAAPCARCVELEQRLHELSLDWQIKESKLAALEAENARLTEQLHALSRTVMSDQVSNDSHSLFIAAIRDLAAINEALELDPDDGGAVPIIDAIDELKATIAQHAEDMLRLIETVKYLRGIAERGTQSACPEEMTVEAFVLGYVKKLESDNRQQAERTKELEAELKERDLQLRHLLCIIHRDGGHHTLAHGLEQSIEDAKEKFFDLRDLPATIAQQAERIRILEEEDTDCHRLKDSAICMQADQLAAAEKAMNRCYKMLLSEPDTKGALFKAENILREALADAAIAAQKGKTNEGQPDRENA